MGSGGGRSDSPFPFALSHSSSLPTFLLFSLSFFSCVATNCKCAFSSFTGNSGMPVGGGKLLGSNVFPWGEVFRVGFLFAP